MIRRPPRSTLSSSSAASDVYKRQPSYKRSFHATPTITTQFQALFTTIFWMLFSFRSPYYYAIGLKTYLVLEVDVPLIPAGFPTHGTHELSQIVCFICTLLSHSLVQHSSCALFRQLRHKDWSYNTTFPTCFHG